MTTQSNIKSTIRTTDSHPSALAKFHLSFEYTDLDKPSKSGSTHTGKSK